MAARLAAAGMRVLLLEAGRDHAHARSREFPDAAPGVVAQCPGYHGASTEDSEMSWQFSVRHYADTRRQMQDDKYDKQDKEYVDPLDPRRPPTRYPRAARFLDQAPEGRKGGIFYPRAAALGGCTSHHAMIIAAPNDKDWNAIAELTGDESWRAENMRGYFARLERCRYLGDYEGFLRRSLGVLYRVWRWIVLQLDPRAVLDDGGHGRDGWQPTSFIDPELVEDIAREDKRFLQVLMATVLKVIHGGLTPLRLLKRALLRLRVVQFIDVNDQNTRRHNPEGVFLIPTGIETRHEVKDVDGSELRGRRTGVREFLLATRKAHPEHLVIVEGVHVTRVIFRDDGGVPRAVGVEYAEGQHLYEASPLRDMAMPAPKGRKQVFVRRGGEIILSGGAFNTPQLLMLSGIGDKEHLDALSILGPRDGAGEVVSEIVDLPGVGRNLQDRYEVTVVSEVSDEFSTLKDVSFVPGDPRDGAAIRWTTRRDGLYATNGGALAVLTRSHAVREAGEAEPDLFTFGAPAAFRGYYWGWSRDLLKPYRESGREQRDLWTWVILKAYTRNEGGTVRLVSADPFVQPEICFDSFNEAAERRRRELEEESKTLELQWDSWDDARGPRPESLVLARARLEREQADVERAIAGSRRDLEALVDAIRFMRSVNAANGEHFVRELQPGPALGDDTDELREWIKTQAWGHHASCTCRIGADPWRARVSDLLDRHAVLDSRFRVHGARGLRVVDASVFPNIPGYFILTPILMASEKAADTLLSERRADSYPARIEEQEAAAILRRREVARVDVGHASGDGRLPDDVVGLALSGGGVRSATFSLGVLQTLARTGFLRRVDLLSAVSGGGFTGAFLGRLFTRPSVTSPPPGRSEPVDPCGRVEKILSGTQSAQLWWLRANGNYLFASGAGDLRQNIAVFFRNILAVHFVLGAFAFAIFGACALVASAAPIPSLADAGVIEFSRWWWTPIAALVLAVLPLALGYWLSRKSGSVRPYRVFALGAWLVLLVGAVVSFLAPGGAPFAAAGLGAVLLAWLYQEIARWGVAAGFRSLPEADSNRVCAEIRDEGRVARNRLTRGLGEALGIFVFLVGFVILDTLARSLVRFGVSEVLAGIMAMLAPALPLLHWLGEKALQRRGNEAAGTSAMPSVAKLLGIPLVLFALLVVDTLAHALCVTSPEWCLGVVVLLFVVSLVLGRDFDFLNLSSLHATYASHLIRTFLGASNEARIHATAASGARDVQVHHPQDDLPFRDYHPERYGGPLHLVNVCVNETIDLASSRTVAERKGLPMCVGPAGVSVGRKYFAAWTKPGKLLPWQRRNRWLDGIPSHCGTRGGDVRAALSAARTTSNPNAFHVLAAKDCDRTDVEALSLGAWVAISGAAFTTGTGRTTELPLSILCGLANVRLGYWWDSGLQPGDRPGVYPLPLWRRIKSLPASLFKLQYMLLSEWRGRLSGPSHRFWYLSDGGHFDVTGLYELVRRKAAFTIFVDASLDSDYRWSDVANAMRLVRTDFGAEIRWIDFAEARRKHSSLSWETLLEFLEEKVSLPPPWIRERIDLDGLGSLDQIGRDGSSHAALALVRYPADPDPDRVSWILLLKPSLSKSLGRDVLSYAAAEPAFPQTPTSDQVFDDEQWESYRSLGEQVAQSVILEKEK